MKFVLALSIGPVGGFIAAGRRSRDLWYGSSWLSETTRNVAECLRGANSRVVHVELLLPTEERFASLSAKYEKTRGLEGGRVSNKVLAVVECDDTLDTQSALRSLAIECRVRAREFLINEINELISLRNKGVLESLISTEAFNRQVEAIRQGDFVELSAAWAPLPPGKDPFGASVSRACRLRDATPKLFVHPGFSRLGIARSDLDEGRDSVLRPTDEAGLHVPRAKAGIIESEELDAIGLLRRAGPYLDRKAGQTKLMPLPFRPLASTAADPWLEGVSGHPQVKGILEELRETLRGASDEQGEDFFIWCSPASSPASQEELFPYDASLLFEGGCEALLVAVERLRVASKGSWGRADSVRATLQSVQQHVRRLHQRAGVPIQYYALLELDGDRMGSLLGEQCTRDGYNKLVKALDTFADGAAVVVTRHGGTAFYVAGDELAAYVPLDCALDLVAELAASFRDALEKEGFPKRSLSAGVVFAHVKDDLRGVRKAARVALKRAKEAGGAHVCVREMPRAGFDREVGGPIGELPESMKTLAESIQRGDISLRTEQHLRDHLERFKDVLPAAGIPPGVRLAKDAVRRQFERAGRHDGQHPLAGRIDRLETWDDVRALADEIRIASRIADVRAQRGTP